LQFAVNSHTTLTTDNNDTICEVRRATADLLSESSSELYLDSCYCTEAPSVPSQLE